MTRPAVRSIEWLSQDAEEAALEVSDGTFACRAFCHPCGAVVGQHVVEPLLAFATREVEQADEEPSVALGDDGLSHRVCAPVLSVSRTGHPTVALGEILIELDAVLPGDLAAGDKIRFRCARLDFFS